MKTQKYTSYIVSVLASSSLILSRYFDVNSVNGSLDFLSNLFLNIFGGAFLALIVALIAYFTVKEEVMENFYKSFRKLYNVSTSIKSDSTFKEYESWFDDYIQAVDELKVANAKISFIFDCFGRKKYFNEIINYYADFVVLTQEDFRLLGEKLSDDEKEKIKEKISKVLFEKKVFSQGIIRTTSNCNRLTSAMIVHHNNIYNICCEKSLKRFSLNITLVSEDNFNLLPISVESYVKDIIKISKKTGAADVEVNVPKEIIKTLSEQGYIRGYEYISDEKVKLNCHFILFHYFELKKRFHDIKTSEYEDFTLNFYTITLSICFVIKQIWINILQYLFPGISSIFCVLILLIVIYTFLVSINYFWKYRSPRTQEVVRKLGARCTSLSILFYLASDIVPDLGNKIYTSCFYVVCIGFFIGAIIEAIKRK